MLLLTARATIDDRFILLSHMIILNKSLNIAAWYNKTCNKQL